MHEAINEDITWRLNEELAVVKGARMLLPKAVWGCGRGLPAVAAEGGTRRERDKSGMHDHGQAAGRLAEGSVRERGRHHRPHVSGVGRCGGVKAHLQDIQGSQIHGAVAGCGIQEPFPLV